MGNLNFANTNFADMQQQFQQQVIKFKIKTNFNYFY
jgi:hypothetical protein